MKYYLIFIFLILGLASCNKEQDTGRGGDMDDPNFVYDMYAWEYSLFESHINKIFSSQDGKKANIIKGHPTEKIEYFTVDSTELKAIKKCLYNFLAANDSLYTLKRYYRQYIGYKLNNNKFVYVNLFTHVQFRGESTPDLLKKIYTEDEGQCDFGHIIINLKTDEVTECEFINKPF